MKIHRYSNNTDIATVPIFFTPRGHDIMLEGDDRVVDVVDFKDTMLKTLVLYNTSYITDSMRPKVIKAIDHIIFMMSAFDLTDITDDCFNRFYNIIAIYTKSFSFENDFRIAVENVIMHMINTQ